ncbi:hypothetical protein JL720_3620 [Aureococcus anophagefferens]|nr:hypothetical protein JL720_3620 [Aureococcus anophagefferens]
MLARELEAAGGDAAAAPGGDAAAARRRRRGARRRGARGVGGEPRAIGGEPAPAWEGGQRSASPSDATASDGDDAPRGPGRVARGRARTKGRIAQAACAACGASNGEKPIKLSELARSATASAIVHAAKTGRARSLEDVYREAHRHAGKSCDASGAPGACAVVHDLDKVAKALVLSVAWFSTDQDAADVRALLGLAAKSLDARRCFEDATPKEPAVRMLHLVAMVTFKDNHYTAFVKDKHGHWTWHDKAEATACRGWKDVVDRCCKTKGAPMLPYLLLYDNPVEVPPAAR